MVSATIVYSHEPQAEEERSPPDSGSPSVLRKVRAARARQRVCCSCYGSSAPSLEVLVEVIEDGHTALEPCGILLVRHGDAGDETIDTRYLGPLELSVLEVDVVHDLRDRSKRGVSQSKSRRQDFKRAKIPFV